MKTVDIYIEVSYKIVHKRQKTAWGAVLVYDGGKKEILYDTSGMMSVNEAMLAGIAKVLNTFTEPHNINIHHKSHTIDGMFNMGWYRKWEKNGFHTRICDRYKRKIVGEKWVKQIGKIAKYHKINCIKSVEITGENIDLAKLKAVDLLHHGLTPCEIPNNTVEFMSNLGENHVVYDNFHDKPVNTIPEWGSSKDFFKQKMLLTI